MKIQNSKYPRYGKKNPKAVLGGSPKTHLTYYYYYN